MPLVMMNILWLLLFVGIMEADTVLLEAAAAADASSRNRCHGLVAGEEKDGKIQQAQCDYGYCRRSSTMITVVQNPVARPGVVVVTRSVLPVVDTPVLDNAGVAAVPVVVVPIPTLEPTISRQPRIQCNHERAGHVPIETTLVPRFSTLQSTGECTDFGMCRLSDCSG